MAIQLPPLHQRIILDPTGVKGGAAAYASSMGGVAKASGKAANSVAMAGGAVNTMAFRMQTAGRVMLKNFALPLGAIGGLAIKSFGEFERSMLKIEALVGVSAGQVERFGDAVKAAAQETGRGPQELADAMFFVASAGLRGATAMEVLRASAKGAALGLGQTKVVADAATSAVNAYGAENLSGSEAVDVLTAAVREGKVEANRLAPAIGKAIPVASAMGIEFHEVAAAIAAMTRTGTDARTSAIQLRQIMQSILDPSRQTTKALTEMGIAEGELRRQAEEEGLLAVLKRLRDLAKDNEDAFADVFPNIRALAGALDITGANLTENEGIFRALANSVGDTDEAFQKASKGALFKFNKAMADLKVNMLEFGEAMVPLLEILVGAIGKLSAFVKALSTEPMGKFLAVVVGVTAAVGLLLITIGKTIAVVQGLSFAMLNLATTTGAAATAMAALQVVMALSGVLLLVGVIGALTVGLFGMGKSSKNAAKELADLSGEIRDVRQMGERSLRPIHLFTDALRTLTGEAADPKIIQDFNAAFGDMIEKAGDIQALGGQIQAEESIIQAFFGTLAGVDDQEIIDETMDTFDMLLARFRIQFQDADFFTRMFGDPEDMDAALVAFLQGEDAESAADMQASLWADRIRGTYQQAIDSAFSQLQRVRAGAAVPLEAIITGAAGKIEPALGELAGLFNKALLSGNPEVAMNIYTELLDNLVDTTGMTAQEANIAMSSYQKAFMDALHEVDAFTEDSKEGIDDLHSMFLLLASGQDEVLKGDFTGRDNVVDFAQHYSDILGDMIDQLSAFGEFDWEDITPEMQQAAMDLAVQRVNDLNEELADLEDVGEDAFGTINGALVEMEKGFSDADEAAKQLNDRFDNLMGRGISLEEAQLDFNDGLRDMASALQESDGSISQFTAKGSDARRELLAMIENATGVADTMLGMGFSMEEAEAQYNSLAGAITANALAKGIDQGELEELFAGINFTGDGMALMFADPDEQASEALLDAAENIAAQTGPFVFQAGLDIGDNMLQGFTRGLRGGSHDLRENTKDVFANLILQVKEVFGIDSPSILFRDEIGKPLMEGITVGFAQEAMKAKGQFKNILRSFINDAISTTKGHINSASSAVNAILDLEDATQKLAKAKREHEAIDGGSRSQRENLNERQLQRRVDEAKRALRLGQGHQEDLELALLDAEEALSDFGQNVDSASPVQRAELDLMDAGFAVAESVAQMKMDGDQATEAFTSMAEAVNISTEKINDLLAVPIQGESIFDQMFPDNVKQAIEDVANGIGFVTAATEDLNDAMDDGITWVEFANLMTGRAGTGHSLADDPTAPSASQGWDTTMPSSTLPVGTGDTSDLAKLQAIGVSTSDISVTGDNSTNVHGGVTIQVMTIAEMQELGPIIQGMGAQVNIAETSGIFSSPWGAGGFTGPMGGIRPENAVGVHGG